MIVKSQKFFMFMVLVSSPEKYKYVGECMLANGARYLIDLSKCERVEFVDMKSERRADGKRETFIGLLYFGELIPLDCRITTTNKKSLDDHRLKSEFDLIASEKLGQRIKIVSQ